MKGGGGSVAFFSSTKGGGGGRQAASGSKEQHYHLLVRAAYSQPPRTKIQLFLGSSTHRPSEKGCGSQAAKKKGVAGYRITFTKNMLGKAAFGPALGAIATAAGSPRRTGNTQASKSLDWRVLGLRNGQKRGCRH